MKKILIFVLIMILAVPVSVFAEESFDVVVDTASANPGETVSVNVGLKNNSGLIAALFSMEYDKERLELTEVIDGKLLEGGIFSQEYAAYPYKMVWNSASYENFTEDGVLVTLTFKVRETASAGEAFIRLLYNANDVFDVDLNNVDINVINGSVNVLKDGIVKDNSGNGNGGSSGGGKNKHYGNVSAKPQTQEEDNSSADNVSQKVFSDLEGYEWASEAIYALSEAGVINGTGDTAFSPAMNIKRADFVLMLTRAFEFEQKTGENFADVAQDAYYAQALMIAKNSGLINGIGDNRFNPEGEISRQDMMVILVRVMDSIGYDLPQSEMILADKFSDSALVADYAEIPVSRLVASEIIIGSDGRISPLNGATRAEVAVILDRILNK